jgi:hypothetical protein
VRALALLSLLLAVACLAESGGHCLNPQPDLPCGSADTASKAGSGTSNVVPGSPPVFGSGGAYASAGAANLDLSGSSPAGGGVGGSSNDAAGAPGEAGAGAEAAGAAGDSALGTSPAVR